MENIDWTNINTILNRTQIEKDICNILHDYSNKIDDISFKRGIFIYGPSGCGKTYFAKKILEIMDYDCIYYDTGDVRNKTLFDNIASNNISNRNVLDMMHKKSRKIAIIMDEIEGMNNGDKGGIAALMKLIRQKKTKKQKCENITLNPIICICNNIVDKKIKDLMKVSHVFELKNPTNIQINKLMKLPKMKIEYLNYIQGDLRKVVQLINLYSYNKENFESMFENLYNKDYNEDSKKNTKFLFENDIHMHMHQDHINDNERTIISLLWHENIIDLFDVSSENIKFYLHVLRNICYADFMDRITFQNQIWLFNEISSLIKTLYNNKIYHEEIKNKKKVKDVRFTKILTKYSTEYNNQQFFSNMCSELDMDKKDLISFFNEIKIKCPDDYENTNIFDDYNIGKLDIKRMYKFLEKNTIVELE